MECSNQRGEAELIGTFYLSANENILTIARMKTLFVLLYMTPSFCFVLFFVFHLIHRSHCGATFIDSQFNACRMPSIITV